MSKKMLKRSLALSALMAFVITGSAFAERKLVNSSGSAESYVTYTNQEYNDCTTTASGGAIYNTGHLQLDCCEFQNNTANRNTAQGGAIYNTGNLKVSNSKFIGNKVTGDGRAAGAAIYSNGGSITVDNCHFEDNVANGTKSAYGSVIGITGKANATISNSTFINNNGGTSNGLVYAYNGSKLVLEGNTFSNNDRACVNVTKGTEVTLIGLNTFTNNTNNSLVVNGTTTFAENSRTYFEGGSVNDFGGMGDINVETGALVKSEAGVYSTGNFKLDGTLEIGEETIIENLSGENGLIKFTSTEAALEVTNNTSTGLGIGATGEVNDAVGGDASVLLADVQLNGDTNVVMDAGDIVGQVESVLSTNEDGETIVISTTEATNEANDAIGEASVSLKAHWRAHMNDMNKRMGELRNANGEHGVWVRMVRGESEYEGAKMQYNQYQLGYDEKLSVDKRWTVGTAVTFSEGDGNFMNGSTEDDSTAFAIYGSKLNNDGTFVDLIARYVNMDSDVTIAADKADYSTNGMSVSAEFGKRIQQGKGFWIEPQVELTYGTVDSAEYVIGGKTVQVGDMDSLIGRVGFSMGKDIKQGNVYARASYLYDFDGETETAFSKNGVTRTIAEDLGGGWWEVGVGANINLSKATYIYADVEKTFGGEVDTNWQWNLGVRYSF